MKFNDFPSLGIKIFQGVVAQWKSALRQTREDVGSKPTNSHFLMILMDKILMTASSHYNFGFLLEKNI